MQPPRVTTNRTKIPGMHEQRPATVPHGQVLLWLSVTGFSWLILLGLVLVYPWDTRDLGQHWLLAGAAALVGFVTCAPVEATLQVYGLTVRGIFGAVIVSHIVVFTAVPTRSMLALPEIPVYVLMALGSLFLVASFTLPVWYVVGKKAFARRERRFDVRRAWRQATMFGVALSGVIVLIGLRAFTPILAGLWLLMVVFFEYIVLTFSEPQERRG